MEERSKLLRQQAEALRRIREEWNLSLRQLAGDLGRAPSQASRWEHPYQPQRMSSESRLRLARLIGSHFWHPQQMEAFLHRVGWELTDRERREAEYHLDRAGSLTKIPWVDAARFVGRTQELATLRARLLARGATAPLILLVEGLPGMGKSWLVARLLLADQAVEDHFPDGIMWVSMAPSLSDPGPQNLEERGFRSLVEQIFLDRRIEEHQYAWRPSSRRRVRDALTRKGLLLVLDGVEERIDLDQWMMVDPILGKLLVTTHRTDLESQRWRGRVHVLSLETMTRGESRELLTRGMETGDVSDEDLRWLLRTLGGVPLALDIANRLVQYDKGFSELVIQVRQALLPSLEVTPSVCRQDSLKLTFETSYSRLDEGTARLFRALAISPQPFDTQALSHVLQWNRGNVGRRFRRLAQNGLVWVEEAGRYGTHRLFHEHARFLCHDLDTPPLPTWKRRFAAHYLSLTRHASELWARGDEPEALGIWQQALAHIEQGCEYAAELGQRDWVLQYLLHTGYYPGGRTAEASIGPWRTRFDGLIRQSKEGLFGNLQLGDVWLLLATPDQAIPILQLVRRTAEGLEEERLWLSASVKLAQSFLATGRQRKARELVNEDRYAPVASSLPSGDALQVDAWAIRGIVRARLGRYAEAKASYREALASLEGAEEGSRRWRRVRLLFELGKVCRALQDYAEALEAFEEGMSLAEAADYKCLSNAHALNAVIALARLGRPTEAEERLRGARREHGEEHFVAAWMTLAQAEVSWAAGRCGDAKRPYEVAVERFAGTVAEMHARVLLAQRLWEGGETERAGEAWRRARTSARKTGHCYNYLLATLHYARYLYTEGRDKAAAQLLKEVVAEGVPTAPLLVEQAKALLNGRR